MDIEVVICTHNRSALLQRTIRSLNDAERPARASVSILVAANACTDDTHGFLSAYEGEWRAKGWLRLRWVEVPTPGKSVALNHAVPLVKAAAIAFVDDDHRVAPGYLKAVAEALEGHPEVNLFCGRILPDWDGSEPEWVHDNGPYKVYPLPVPRFDQGENSTLLEPGTATPGGGNLFFRTELFARVGPFPTELGPVGHNLGGAEDIVWVRGALALGERVLYFPAATQYHYVDATRLRLTYVMRKAFERTASTMRVAPEVGATDRLPLYMIRKVLGYAARATFCVSAARRRHYLVRTAASLGELRGFLHRRSEARMGVERV